MSRVTRARGEGRARAGGRAATWNLSAVSEQVKCSVLCPAFVTSNVFDNYEDLRPEAVKSHQETEAGRQMVAGMKQFLGMGMPAREAGEIVLQAIRDERFYILTHP